MERHKQIQNPKLLCVMMVTGILAGAVIVFDVGCDGTVILPGASTGPGGVRGSNRTPTPSNTPEPTASPEPNGDAAQCTEDADCDDGVFCNGAERCNNNLCGNAPTPCNALIETCDEENDTCVAIGLNCLSDVNCPLDQTCDLTARTCVPLEGCGRGACNLANSSPGCNNERCCEDVCLFDQSCCLIQWTQECADMAFSISTCLQP